MDRQRRHDTHTQIRARAYVPNETGLANLVFSTTRDVGGRRAHANFRRRNDTSHHVAFFVSWSAFIVRIAVRGRGRIHWIVLLLLLLLRWHWVSNIYLLPGVVEGTRVVDSEVFVVILCALWRGPKDFQSVRGN